MGRITIRIHNDDSTDEVDITGDTIEEIREKAKDRIKLPTWSNGWSEVIEGKQYIDEPVR